jgi:hypothetical protein
MTVKLYYARQCLHSPMRTGGQTPDRSLAWKHLCHTESFVILHRGLMFTFLPAVVGCPFSWPFPGAYPLTAHSWGDNSPVILLFRQDFSPPLSWVSGFCPETSLLRLVPDVPLYPKWKAVGNCRGFHSLLSLPPNARSISFGRVDPTNPSCLSQPAGGWGIFHLLPGRAGHRTPSGVVLSLSGTQSVFSHVPTQTVFHVCDPQH